MHAPVHVGAGFWGGHSHTGPHAGALGNARADSSSSDVSSSAQARKRGGAAAGAGSKRRRGRKYSASAAATAAAAAAVATGAEGAHEEQSADSGTHAPADQGDRPKRMSSMLERVFAHPGSLSVAVMADGTPQGYVVNNSFMHEIEAVRKEVEELRAALGASAHAHAAAMGGMAPGA